MAAYGRTHWPRHFRPAGRRPGTGRGDVSWPGCFSLRRRRLPSPGAGTRPFLARPRPASWIGSATKPTRRAPRRIGPRWRRRPSRLAVTRRQLAPRRRRLRSIRWPKGNPGDAGRGTRLRFGESAAVAVMVALASSATGCGKPVLRVADASLGDYYTDEEFK